MNDYIFDLISALFQLGLERCTSKTKIHVGPNFWKLLAVRIISPLNQESRDVRNNYVPRQIVNVLLEKWGTEYCVREIRQRLSPKANKNKGQFTFFKSNCKSKQIISSFCSGKHGRDVCRTLDDNASNSDASIVSVDEEEASGIDDSQAEPRSEAAKGTGVTTRRSMRKKGSTNKEGKTMIGL